MKKTLIGRVVGNDYFYTVATKVLVVFINLVSSSYAKRFLGPALDGQLSYITTLLTNTAVIAGIGLYQSYPFHKRQEGPDVLHKYLDIFSMQFLFYSVIGIVLAIVLKQPALIAVCLIAPIQVLANQLSFTLMVEDVKLKNTLFFIARVTNATVTVLAFYTLEPTLLVSLALIIIGDLITVVFGIRRLRYFGRPFKTDFRFLKKIIPFGIAAMLSTLLLSLNYSLDIMMLEWLHIEDAQRGFYNTGASLASYGWLVSDAFRDVLYSRTSKKDALKDVVFSLKVNFYITLVMVIGIALFGRPVIHLLFGAAYLPAYQVTVILLIGVLSMSYFKLIGTLLMAEGKRRVYLLTLSISAAVNVVGNLYAIPIWGIEGAAWASVLSYSVAGIGFLAYFMRSYKVPLSHLFVIRRSEISGLIGKAR